MPLYKMTPEKEKEFNKKHPFNTTIIFGERPSGALRPQSTPATGPVKQHGSRADK